VRIIGGNLRGVKVEPDKKFKGRPTTDFAREALFNGLNSRLFLADVNFLDLFAGSGMIGFEAISRGVTFATGVEKDKFALLGLRANIKKLKFENYELIAADAISFLKHNSEEYQVVFADPPYDYKLYNELVETVFEYGTLAENGLLIVEHDKFNNFDNHPNFIEKKKYGNVIFSFFESK
jgi:16S rRNA (guanine966-N2)-methyltransferase